MIRAKNFLTCPLFALSMHLFYEFHCANNAYQPDGQSFPSFATSPEWYDLKMFSSPNILEELMKIERQKTGDRCKPNTNGFLLLLVELRTVFLQDMVELRQIHPTFFSFEHPLFSSPSFLTYEQHALRTIATSDDPADMRLRQAMPVLAETMKTGFDSLMQATREQASRSEVGEKLIGALATMLTDVLTGVAPVPAATGPLATILALTGGGAAPSTAATSTFAMFRSITTVADLWREYDVGVGGSASVRSQHEVKGHTWTDEAERKHYHRRMIIVRKVKQLASQHTVREVDVAARLDKFCPTSSPKVSLSKLQDLVKKDAVVLQFSPILASLSPFPNSKGNGRVGKPGEVPAPRDPPALQLFSFVTSGWIILILVPTPASGRRACPRKQVRLT
ncbi:hypothetical protein RQP46_011517 [Phenoliferia psychrophenolica]